MINKDCMVERMDVRMSRVVKNDLKVGLVHEGYRVRDDDSVKPILRSIGRPRRRIKRKR